MDYTLIRARKRSLSLQVSSTGEVIARAPLFMPKFLVDRFVQEKSRWIENRQKEVRKPRMAPTEYVTIEELKVYIAQQVETYSHKLGLYPTGIRFSRVHSYWGTCNPAGILSFNLALRFTPKEVVTYVVVHELTHLKYKGHGKRFWDYVEKNYPGTKEAKKILRKMPQLSLA